VRHRRDHGPGGFRDDPAQRHRAGLGRPASPQREPAIPRVSVAELTRIREVRFRQFAAIGVVITCTACASTPSTSAAATVKVGARFPLTGSQAPLAKQEYAGVQIAKDLVNADGGVDGVPIKLLTKDLTAESDAAGRVQELQAEGVHSILGSYSSSLSMPV